MLGASRSSYYAFTGEQTYQKSPSKQLLLKEVKEIFDNHRRRYGSRRVLEEMKDRGFAIGRYQVRSLMREQELQAIQPKSFVPRTTQGDPHLKRSPNLLLEREFPNAPNQVYVGDITFLPLVSSNLGQWLYLAVWMDLFSRNIAGWEVDGHMEESLVIRPMLQLIRNRQPPSGAIVHSDGGGQYGSINFRTLLDRHKFRQSMTRKENHYDNAFIESLFSRFKAELLDGGVFYGRQDACARIFEYIEGYYNTIRKHSSLGYLSPVRFEERYWRNIKKTD